MDDTIELDINKYSITDLENLFRFKKGTKYDRSLVETRTQQIIQLMQKRLHPNSYNNFLTFMNEAKERLFANIPTPPPPTSIRNMVPDPANNIPHTIPPIPREETIIERQNQPYIITQQSEYVGGNLNPLNVRTMKKHITIDTRFRDHYYITNTSDMNIQLPMTLNKVVGLKLVSFEIPYCFFQISSELGNNYFFIEITYDPQEYSGEWKTVAKVVMLGDGNYTIDTFIAALNDALSERDPTDGITPIDPDDPIGDMLFERNPITGRLILSSHNSTRIKNVLLDFQRNVSGLPDNGNTQFRIGLNLGFLNRRYDQCTAYESEALPDPLNIHYIYLAVDDFNNNVSSTYLSAFQNSSLAHNVIARIPLIDKQPFSILTEGPEMLSRKYFGPVDIRKLNIKLYDDHGRTINMKNNNYSFTLEIDMIHNL